MITISAYSLPKSIEEKIELEEYTLGNQDEKVVVKSPKFPEKIVRNLFKKFSLAKKEFEEYKAKEIIRVFSKVAKRWRKKGYEFREIAEKILPFTTKFHKKAIRHYLDSIFRMDEKSITKMIETQIGKISYLDEFSESPVGYSRIFGPEYVVHMFGETIGPQLLSLLESSLLKSPSIVKVSKREPVLTTLVVESIKDVDENLGNYLACLPWKGGDKKVEEKLFSNKDSCIVVYGSEENIEEIRKKAKGKVIGYHQRIGLEVIEEIDEVTPKKVALDVVMFDQHACFSPHVVYVIGKKERVKSFAEALAEELYHIEKEIPRGEIDLDKKSVISMEKITQNLLKHTGLDIEIYDNRTSLVIYEEVPSFKSSCLHRVVYVKPLEKLEKLPEYLESVKGYLQTVGVSMNLEKKKRLAEILYPLGVSRITDCGRIAFPKIEWHHDGKSSLQEMGRWVDIEV